MTACDSYTWHDTPYAVSGTYTYDYTNAEGCPSTDTLHLTVNHSTTGTDTQVACGSFIWIDGVTYTESTTAPTYTLTNAQGCDSVVTLHLTINNPTNSAETVTAYDTYTWTGGNGQTYNASGTYYHSHTDGNGCTQVDTLYLTVYYSSSSEFAATACESYTWDGRTYTESGDHVWTYHDIHGADSVVTLHLTINHGTHSAETVTACDSHTWHDTPYAVSGTYTYDFSNAEGCPSTDTLHLTVNHSTTGTDSQVACGSFTWINGVTYTESTTAPTYTLTNAQGCDSVITLHLTVNNPTNVAFSETACESFIWNGTTYTTSGDYTFAHEDANGCTQVDTLHLTVNNPTNLAISETACESFTWNGTTYTVSGDYTYAHEDANGCTRMPTAVRRSTPCT